MELVPQCQLAYLITKHIISLIAGSTGSDASTVPVTTPIPTTPIIRTKTGKRLDSIIQSTLFQFPILKLYVRVRLSSAGHLL